MIVAVPFVEPRQLVAVCVKVAASAGPGETVTESAGLIVHPLASVTVIVCIPAPTPLNVVVGPVCVTVPFNTKVKGAVPLVGLTVMVPLLAPRQLVLVLLEVAVKPEPAPMAVASAGRVTQPPASVIVTVYGPEAKPVKVAVLPVWVIAPGFNIKV